MNNTVTLLTAPGTAALAVVQIRGSLVGSFLQTHFTNVPVGGLRHGTLRDEAGETIDDPLVARVDEQIAEISTHGGLWIVERVMRLCTAFGFERDVLTSRDCEGATPNAACIHDSKFLTSQPPMHAVAEGRSLTVAARSVDPHALVDDMLAALPRAPSELALRWLLAQPELWAAEGATIDPADATLFNLLRVPKVAIVGRPNAGKSTLANRLFGQDRSVVSALPGTTRDWVGERADLDGSVVQLIDTPGLRATEDVIEAEAIDHSGGVIASADVVVHLIDATDPEPPRDRAVVAYNKMDQAATVAVPPSVCPLSATAGEGVADLVARIRDRLLRDPQTIRAALWLPAHRA